jgi:hypothetical protein
MKYQKTKKWKYRLAEQFDITLNIAPATSITTNFISFTSRHLCLIKGYAWDGASGPCPDVKSVMIGALVHDALYQLMRLKLLDTRLRLYADRELRDLSIESGMPKFWANIVYLGVRWFAFSGAIPKKDEPIYEINLET